MTDPQDLPAWISLRGLAKELRPADRPLNAFKWELGRILKAYGVEARGLEGGKRRYFLSDLEEAAPFLVSTWIRMRQLRQAGVQARRSDVEDAA